MTGLSTLPSTLLLIALAVGAILIVAAYFLKMKRRRFEVPFAHLWQRVLKDVESKSLFHRLRKLLSLLLQLAIFAMLAGTAFLTTCGQKEANPRNTVYLVDTSASMGTTDVNALPRLRAAKAELRRMLKSKDENDAAIIVGLDHLGAPVSRFTSDLGELLRQSDSLSLEGSRADIKKALHVAENLLDGRQRPEIVILGDGQYAETLMNYQSKTSGVKIFHKTFGSATENIALTGFSVRRYPTNRLSFEGMLEVSNTGEKSRKSTLQVSIDESVIEEKTIELDPGESKVVLLPDLGGSDGNRLTAKLLNTADLFTADDTAYAIVPDSKLQKLLVVTSNNKFLSKGLEAYSDIVEAKTVSPADFERMPASKLKSYEAIVFDDYTPKTLPENANILMFNPDAASSPIPTKSKLNSPRITKLTNHPVARWLVLSDVNFVESKVFSLDRSKRDKAVALSIRSPIIAARNEGHRQIVVAGFSLGKTDLVLRVGFPLLLINVLDWFSNSTTTYLASIPTGQSRRIAVENTSENEHSTVTLIGENEQFVVPVTRGIAEVNISAPGFYDIVDENETTIATVAANIADRRESTIAPTAKVMMGNTSISEPSIAKKRRTNFVIWRYLVLAAILLLFVEWGTYHRRITL